MTFVQQNLSPTFCFSSIGTYLSASAPSSHLLYRILLFFMEEKWHDEAMLADGTGFLLYRKQIAAWRYFKRGGGLYISNAANAWAAPSPTAVWRGLVAPFARSNGKKICFHSKECAACLAALSSAREGRGLSISQQFSCIANDVAVVVGCVQFRKRESNEKAGYGLSN